MNNQKGCIKGRGESPSELRRYIENRKIPCSQHTRRSTRQRDIGTQTRYEVLGDSQVEISITNAVINI